MCLDMLDTVITEYVIHDFSGLSPDEDWRRTPGRQVLEFSPCFSPCLPGPLKI
jgi:hypothetical protein